jgi:hypothetical protein
VSGLPSLNDEALSNLRKSSFHKFSLLEIENKGFDAILGSKDVKVCAALEVQCHELEPVRVYQYPPLTQYTILGKSRRPSRGKMFFANLYPHYLPFRRVFFET